MLYGLLLKSGLCLDGVQPKGILDEIAGAPRSSSLEEGGAELVLQSRALGVNSH